MNAREVGIAVVALGGGRSHADDAIDPSVGFTEFIDVGTASAPASRSASSMPRARPMPTRRSRGCARPIRIGEPAPPPRPVVIDRIVE